jgi:O-antigen/teichoic acid export membrane protein
MIFDPYISFFEALYKAWFGGERRVRAVIVIAIILVTIAVAIAALAQPVLVEKRIADVIAAILGVIAGVLTFGVIAYQNYIEQEARKDKIEEVEQRVREHPEKPQLAWDLARAKLESYLDRNLSQVRSIYWLTLLVMFVGFGFVLYGLYHAFQSPDKLAVSIVASASGVLISFIGGSFLLIYRSILGQSKDYVAVLERINAVGMAVQVISNIPEASGTLRDQTTAELARQLLSLYASTNSATSPGEKGG